MKKTLVTAVLFGTTLVTAIGAAAAPPKKSATYVGDIKSSPFTMHVDLKVNPAGNTLQHFTYLCGTGRPPTTVFKVPIDRTGHFKWTAKTGSVTTWKLLGRFLSATKARVSLSSLACGGSKGSTTATMKP